ncbi:MAG: divalent-cation tolerance protein CutA [Candidatus Methanofastidiosia archaeon]|jgi:periplasmic divalent cation tolerance protein
MDYSVVYMTCSSKKEAHTIATELVQTKLIACANIFPISSVYTWKQKIHHDTEYAAILKTKKTNVPKVIEEVKRMHSYEVPDIVEIPLGRGFKPFFQWISEVVE